MGKFCDLLFELGFDSIHQVMSDLAKQNYELAFHISANLEEADVQKTRQDIENMITSHGGAVSFARNPEKLRLAYPVEHQSSAFFGYFNFNLESLESANQIRDALRLNDSILRFMILKQEPESKTKKEDIVRRMAMAEKRKAKAKAAEKMAGQKQETPKVDEKQIDEKLEEIIEKL